jgi:hypothetical protein
MGDQLSAFVGSQIIQSVTDSNTDKAMTLYIAGAVSIVVGIYLFIKIKQEASWTSLAC